MLSLENHEILRCRTCYR